MSDAWETELVKFLELDLIGRFAWLSKLFFSVSMLARDTYEVGSDGVEKPKLLRRYNEFLHRLSSHQLKIAKGELDRMPDEQFFLLIAEESKALGIDEALLSQLQQ